MKKHIILILSLMSVCVVHVFAQDKAFTEVARLFFDPSKGGEGVPYVASTLEPKAVPTDPVANVEELVVRLDAVDCTTLVEYVTAERLALQARHATQMPATREEMPRDSLFLHYLQALRYRGGERGNYATRKHYFSEWISDGEQQGLVREVTQELAGAVKEQRTINFMSRNVKYYPQLQACRRLQQEVMAVEQELSTHIYYYIPSAQIDRACPQLQHGDIVVFVTDTPGLDVQHTGFVWWPDPAVGAPRLYHASSAKKCVTLDEGTLQEYAQRVKHCVGIRVVRVRKP